MALKDFPAIHAEFNKLMAEKDALRAKSAPLHDKRAKLREKMVPLEAQDRELIEQIRAIERPRMAEIDEELSRMAMATGGKVMSKGGA